MERADLLKENANIFSVQGKALNKHANRDELRVVVVGNPANTNALIASCNAPNIDPTQFTAMTRLDHNRGLAQIAAKADCLVTDIHKFAIWGNHSSTQYPDVSHTRVKDKWLKDIVNQKWVEETFIPTGAKDRGCYHFSTRVQQCRVSSQCRDRTYARLDHGHGWGMDLHGRLDRQEKRRLWCCRRHLLFLPGHVPKWPIHHRTKCPHRPIFRETHDCDK